MNRSTKFAAGSVLLLGLTLLLVSINPTATATAQEDEVNYAPAGAADCLDCHDKTPEVLILNTPHAQRADSRSPFSSHDCESCHGASSTHMRKIEGELTPPLPAVIFSANSPNPVAEQNAVCLDCHEDERRMEWVASQHESADIACADCHNVHATKDPVLVKTSQDEVCYGCHVEQRAQSFRRSRHPIREGKVACADCHNPHGSVGPKLLKEASVNETCFGCHTEKRGPFLWEHAPVADDCTNCHTPHGSAQARLLKIRTPFLCQQCHQEAFHPSTLYSGDDVPPFGVGERIIANGCLNCHFKIHGSNHPSGVRFTR